ncbi:reticulon family protein [Tripterygium wilfordii]|uniref:Reticulon-like protein n=1 Tax=Tripterygium wilfordii TaxID=458696 RepID=A0A7J7CIX2_TRIWF|nr:reticulon-like protein B9 [Tripterygium wilfordii]KAF5734007.1 reticulon family protein [Tripterygium wilfordii]
MPIYESPESDNEGWEAKKLFGRQRPIHSVLGGGRVADILLWKETKLSASLLAVLTLVWFLFEVVEYNFVTLVSHISITGLLIVFIWSTSAEFFNWNPPRIPQYLLHESTFNEVAATFHRRLSHFLTKLLEIACGKDPRLFIMTIPALYVLSVIGNYFSFLNLLYFGFVTMFTVPYLYDRYETEVDHFAGRFGRDAKKNFRKFDSNVLNKIPRGKKVR